jgi:imidazolonepropionase-like amidohydrolase
MSRDRKKTRPPPFSDFPEFAPVARHPLIAAVEICRQSDFKVMAHATNPQAVKNAIKLGSHSVEHGYVMDDDCIELSLKHDTWCVPTLAISHLSPNQSGNEWEGAYLKQRSLAPSLRCRADAARNVHATWLRKALDAGVKLALGSDIRPLKDAGLADMVGGAKITAEF